MLELLFLIFLVVLFIKGYRKLAVGLFLSGILIVGIFILAFSIAPWTDVIGTVLLLTT